MIRPSLSLRSLSVRQVLLAGASVLTLIAVAHSAQAGMRRGTLPPSVAVSPVPGGGASAPVQPGVDQNRAAFIRDRMTLRRTLIDQARAALVVPDVDGLADGGLMPSGGLSGGTVSGDTTSYDTPAGWTGIDGLSQTDGGTGPVVRIDQGQDKAILTWETFNIGSKTTLNFDQSGSNAVALNKVVGDGVAPSQILGKMTADGSVYVLNQNGIVFGAGSQVNVHSLVASTGTMTDDQFLDHGLTSQLVGNTYEASLKNAMAGTGAHAGVIRVDGGATITTRPPEDVTTGGGNVLLLGGTVENHGTISTPKGQTLLAAGDDFILRPGFGTEANQESTTRGFEVAPVVHADSTAGAVSNDGLIFAQQGDITLAGRTIAQDGILLATTSVDQRGTIHLLNSASDTAGSVVLGGESVTAVLPETSAVKAHLTAAGVTGAEAIDDTATALNSQRDALVEASGNLNTLATGQYDNLSVLADRKDQSRIEIVTGGDVIFRDGSLTQAQGGQVAVSARHRVFAEDGSIIDVSGVRGVTLDAESMMIKVNIQGNELRDSPLNRESGNLHNNDVWVDIRDLILVPADDTYDSDRYYTAGGLLEVSGYVASTGHTIGEWAAVAGTITLDAPEVVAQQGATFDVSGGSIHYRAGDRQASLLQGADGAFYDLADAPANRLYLGIGGRGYVVDNGHWGEASLVTRGLGRGQGMRQQTVHTAAYTVGRDAGTLQLSAETAVFEGTIEAGVVTGEHQTKRRIGTVADGYKVGHTAVARAGQLALGRYNDLLVEANSRYDVDVKVGDIAGITDDMDAGDALAAERVGTAWFDAGLLTQAELGGLTLKTLGDISIDSAVTVADGGSVTLRAPAIDIRADITARSGLIDAAAGYPTLANNGEAGLTVHEDVRLDARGLWVNMLDTPADQAKLAFIDGGAVSLVSNRDLVVAEGSRIDVSSGAASLTGGGTRGGVGGDITLVADANSGDDHDGVLTLNGTLAGYGVNGGGTLTLRSGTGIIIGGVASDTDDVLSEGEASPVNLILDDDYTVAEGETLPVDYSYEITVAPPGEAIGGNPATGRGEVVDGVYTYTRYYYVLQDGWIPQRLETGGSYSILVYSSVEDAAAGQNGTTVRIRSSDYNAGDWESTYIKDGEYFFPEGTIVQFANISGGSTFPQDWVIPASAFPDGVHLIDPKSVTVRAGMAAPVDVTLTRGSVLPAGTVLARDALVKAPVGLDPALFETGFTGYDVGDRRGVAVAAGADVAVTVPVYRFADGFQEVASGSDAGDALDLWEPPLFQWDDAAGSTVQRTGADLSLGFWESSGGVADSSGVVTIGEGAMVTVDPGHAIALDARDILIDGVLTARGGSIALTTRAFQRDNRTTASLNPNLYWMGDTAVLDVSGISETRTGARGQAYGVVRDGGSILVGGDIGWESDNTKTETNAPNAYVVVRPGAILDASGGAEVTLDTAAGARRVAGDGGSIVIKSGNAIYLDGTLRAASGGANAGGGTLAVALDTLYYSTNTTPSISPELAARNLVIANRQGDSLLPDDLTYGTARRHLTTGDGRLGVDTVTAGGFDNLSLLAGGALTFEGDVTLAMGQSLRLYGGTIKQAGTPAADSTAAVSLTAPYIRLGGTTKLGLDGMYLPAEHWARGAAETVNSARFTATASGVIDISNAIGFGKTLGYDDVRLVSAGDIRLLAGRTAGYGYSATELGAPGALTLTAAQVYAATNSEAAIDAGTTLTVKRSDGATVPDVPYSLFSTLTLMAPEIVQAGIVRAPMGVVRFGGISSAEADRAYTVTLAPGSITSVSAAGLTALYGGTVDGLTYAYDGEEIEQKGLGWSRVDFNSVSRVLVDEGATIDLRGGGTVAGGAFVSGRGGSVNILTTPLADAGPGYTGISAGGNAVYAIVPGAVGYAPGPTTADAGAPLAGRQVTIPDGVPGLPAGTYTLMPSSFALLPGAYRVEIGAGQQTTLAGATALGNGSYLLPGTLGIAHTAIREGLPNAVVITSGAAVRTHSEFKETSYDTFVLDTAASRNVVRHAISQDGKLLSIQYLDKQFDLHADDPREALRFDGDLLLRSAEGSGAYDGQVQVGGITEIRADGQARTEGMTGTSVLGSVLSGLEAPRLMVNAGFTQSLDAVLQNTAVDRGGLVVVRSGVTLEAGTVILGGKDDFISYQVYDPGTLLIEDGASIIAKDGYGRAFDSSDGHRFEGGGLLVVSNGWMDLTGSAYDLDIDIGGCAAGHACDGTARVIAAGTLGFTTAGAIDIADDADYGAKYLLLSTRNLNLGSAAALASAEAAGILPDGLRLSQARLDSLIAGSDALGAPALERLVLNATGALNVYGTVDLDARGVDQLALGTGAIHGYGASGDVGTITANTLIWRGAESAVAPVTGALGAGALALKADTIRLGYPDGTLRMDGMTDTRTALGFETVTLEATKAIVAQKDGTLAAYRTRGAYDPETGWTYDGGNLTLAAPVVTGQNGAALALSTGGALAITGASGGAQDGDAATAGGYGAQISASADSVLVDTRVVLPSGIFTAEAEHGIALGDAAVIDLSGRTIEMNDIEAYTWGGDLTLRSRQGDVSSAAGSVIDLSAENNAAGTMTVEALGQGAGLVDLRGAVHGSATGQKAVGGGTVPYTAAEVSVSARTLSDFAGLNALLNTGEVYGARHFRLGSGDLTVGDGVKAGDVSIVLDNGDLTVDGLIDASGYEVGRIVLAASGDLTVTGTLDAHGRGLRVDSHGGIIDSPNRAIVDLTSIGGTLALGASAAIDLRMATDVPVGTAAGQNDGVARGTLDLNARRVGADDVAVIVAGTPSIRGARTIAVNAFRTYDDAPLAGSPDTEGKTPQVITQAYLDAIHGESAAFITAALSNAALSGRLAGLDGYHLRPGVEITSNATTNPDGHMMISGDLDLSGYRYGPDADGATGAGEPGVLSIRAKGDLDIYGSVNDGFVLPAAVPGGKGWILLSSDTSESQTTMPEGAPVVVQDGSVTLASGTRFYADETLNYAIPVDAMTLPAGTVLPTAVTLNGSLTLGAGTVLETAITGADGTVYAAGTILPASVTLAAGSILPAGTRLWNSTPVQAMTWPAGAVLPVAMVLSADTSLKRGAIIPGTTDVQLAGGATSQPLRSETDGVHGRDWAVAGLMEAGTASWDMSFVAGADLTSADRQAVVYGADGSLTLGDTHYTGQEQASPMALTEEGSANLLFGLTIYAGYTEEQLPFAWSQLLALGYTTAPTFEDYCASGAYCSGGGGVFTQEGLGLSVLRTGAGDLALNAAADVVMNSLYGVYTAGSAATVADAFNRTRADIAQVNDDGKVGAALDTYQAWYPTDGGNLLVSAGGNLTGYINGYDRGWDAVPTSIMGNWLWRQGTGSAPVDQPIDTAWWVNFGTYTKYGNVRDQTGFTGLGTLGGGDVSIRVGGDAGILRAADYVDAAGAGARSSGLVLAVGSSGMVDADGTATIFGGGDLDIKVSGALNPHAVSKGDIRSDLGGAVTNMRGATTLRAASIGSVSEDFGRASLNDPMGERQDEAGFYTTATASTGIVLAPGDSVFSVETLGDMALAGAADPTRTFQPNPVTYARDGVSKTASGYSWFTSWTDETAINLLSAGGAMAPTAVGEAQGAAVRGYGQMVDGAWPARASMIAPGGSIYLGAGTYDSVGDYQTESLFAPLGDGKVTVAAGSSIIGFGDVGLRLSRHVLVPSVTGTAIPTIFAPAFTGTGYFGVDDGNLASSTSDGGLMDPYTGLWTDHVYSLFAFGPNVVETATSGRSASASPVRVYAMTGDILGLGFGTPVSYADGNGTGTVTGYSGGGPLFMSAGRDIVNSGLVTYTSDGGSPAQTPNVIVHGDPNDVSLITAGRDILYSTFNVVGPGTLDISAGRTVRMEDKASVASLGARMEGDTRPGASVAITAGASDLDWQAVRDAYLDPSKVSDSIASGGVAKAYTRELADWVAERYGVYGSEAEILAYFDGRPLARRKDFLRKVFYAELKAAGREYNDPDSSRHRSYLRGRNMISTLFPQTDADGQAITRGGDIIMFGDMGVHTDFGGTIQLLAPGGRIVVGVEGTVPGAGAGLITQGAGDIQAYSQGSVMLGLSRIMTTFGGDILAWSAEGDINAGRGAKTTVLYTPPKRVYDAYGNVTLSPVAPASGAGIATLSPIPQVPAGDVDLIAPLGTIDAGEAGIRVSGDVNVAALRVVNAANIQVQGTSTGVPITVTTTDVGALNAASSTAGQGAQAAEDAARASSQRSTATTDVPSIITFEVIGYGGGRGGDARRPSPRDRQQESMRRTYDDASPFQIVGAGDLNALGEQALTEEEKQALRQP